MIVAHYDKRTWYVVASNTNYLPNVTCADIQICAYDSRFDHTNNRMYGGFFKEPWAEITKGMFCDMIHKLVGLKPMPDRIKPITPLKRLTFWDNFFLLRRYC